MFSRIHRICVKRPLCILLPLFSFPFFLFQVAVCNSPPVSRLCNLEPFRRRVMEDEERGRERATRNRLVSLIGTGETEQGMLPNQRRACGERKQRQPFYEKKKNIERLDYEIPYRKLVSTIKNQKPRERGKRRQRICKLIQTTKDMLKKEGFNRTKSNEFLLFPKE